jgi:hypothetical protein
MRLHNLFALTRWEQVEPELDSWYKIDAPSMQAHQRAFEEIRTIVPEPDPDGIVTVLLQQARSEDGHVYVDVSGLDQDRGLFAIEFMRWKHWLDCQVEFDPPTMTINEIVAHCLYEMTFCGFTEAPIQQQRADLTAMMDQIKTTLETEGGLEGALESGDLIEIKPEDLA